MSSISMVPPGGFELMVGRPRFELGKTYGLNVVAVPDLHMSAAQIYRDVGMGVERHLRKGYEPCRITGSSYVINAPSILLFGRL